MIKLHNRILEMAPLFFTVAILFSLQASSNTDFSILGEWEPIPESPESSDQGTSIRLEETSEGFTLSYTEKCALSDCAFPKRGTSKYRVTIDESEILFGEILEHGFEEGKCRQEIPKENTNFSYHFSALPFLDKSGNKIEALYLSIDGTLKSAIPFVRKGIIPHRVEPPKVPLTQVALDGSWTYSQIDYDSTMRLDFESNVLTFAVQCAIPSTESYTQNFKFDLKPYEVVLTENLSAELPGNTCETPLKTGDRLLFETNNNSLYWTFDACKPQKTYKR